MSKRHMVGLINSDGDLVGYSLTMDGIKEVIAEPDSENDINRFELILTNGKGGGAVREEKCQLFYDSLNPDYWKDDGRKEWEDFVREQKDSAEAKLAAAGIKVVAGKIAAADVERATKILAADQTAVASARMDAFLDDATHAVKDLWEKASSRKMATVSQYELNSALTQFFSGVKYDWFIREEAEAATDSGRSLPKTIKAFGASAFERFRKAMSGRLQFVNDDGLVMVYTTTDEHVATFVVASGDLFCSERLYAQLSRVD